MLKRLLYLVTLLALTTSAVNASPVVVIDDFESYWGSPAMVTPSGPWSGVALPGTTNTLMLLTAGAPQGAQAMQWEYNVAGGWMYPDDPTNYETNSSAYITNASVSMDLSSPDMELHFMINPGSGIATDVQYVAIEFDGTAWGQALILTSSYADAWTLWWPPPPCLAVIAEPGWVPIGWNPDPSIIIHPGEWSEILVTPDKAVVDWGGAPFSELTSVDLSFGILGWEDDTGASGDPKLDGMQSVWPADTITGTIGIDNIWLIPEPTTIAILALGALALRRTKKH